MSAADLLRELAARGITVHREGNALRYRAPAPLAPDLLARLKAAKPELLALLPNQHAEKPTQDLPLLAALAKYDALIARLRCPESEREYLRDLRRRMSPDAVRENLPHIRARTEASTKGAPD